MTDPEQAMATQLRNLEAKMNRTLEELCAQMLGSGAVKHGELRSFAMEAFGLGYGDANSLAREALNTKGASDTPSADTDAFAQIYPPKKAHLRPIHDALMVALASWGEYEIAPKKSYVALRRKKQFAMLGPKSAERSELGINLKEEVGNERIVKQKPGGMCPYAVSLASPEDIDQEVLTVLRLAFDAAGWRLPGHGKAPCVEVSWLTNLYMARCTRLARIFKPQFGRTQLRWRCGRA